MPVVTCVNTLVSLYPEVPEPKAPPRLTILMLAGAMRLSSGSMEIASERGDFGVKRAGEVVVGIEVNWLGKRLSEGNSLKLREQARQRG
jgi:hypothetical protein